MSADTEAARRSLERTGTSGARPADYDLRVAEAYAAIAQAEALEQIAEVLQDAWTGDGSIRVQQQGRTRAADE